MELKVAELAKELLSELEERGRTNLAILQCKTTMYSDTLSNVHVVIEGCEVRLPRESVEKFLLEEQKRNDGERKILLDRIEKL